MDQDSIVILGSSVIGLSTAYYLAISLKESGADIVSSRPRVVVIEPSHNICPGASGGATGGLGDFGFTDKVTALGEFSHKLHRELASAYQGRENWGFRDQEILRVAPKNFTGDLFPSDSWGPKPPLENDLPSLPSWINTSDHWSVQSLAEAPHAAHIDPARFCQFLYQQCQQLGVRFYFDSAVTSVQRADDTESFRSVTIETKKPIKTTEVIPCNALVIESGPWSSNVFSQLFPEALVKLHMITAFSAGNHVRVRIPRFEASCKQQNSTQVFLNNVLPDSYTLDITSFPDDSLYLGGWGAIPEHLPEYADNIKPQQAEIDALLEMAYQYLRLGPGDMLEVFDEGRCYRPRAVPDRPIITRVKWSLLGDVKDSQMIASSCSKYPVRPEPAVLGGLYINTGHNSDGVTLSLGSGKVMSELLLGQTPSVSISDLDLEF